MRVYIYRADLYCRPCGEAVRKRLDVAGKRPADSADERTYDSDDYPKGPLPEGVSDSPSHCAGCGEFLETPLTPAGVEYVRDAIESARLIGDDESVALADWLPFYGEAPRRTARRERDSDVVQVYCRCGDCASAPPERRAGGGSMTRRQARELGHTIREG